MNALNNFAFYWIFTGLLGGFLAAKLGILAAEDKGALKSSGLNGALALVVHKMQREAFFRFLVSALALYVGVVILVSPHAPHVHFKPAGLSTFYAFSIVKTGNIVVSFMDLRDRDALIKKGLANAHE